MEMIRKTMYFYEKLENILRDVVRCSYFFAFSMEKIISGW